jgi:hypothetical protein
MSDIAMIVDYCKCHMLPADQCEKVLGMVQRGVPLSDLTHEVTCPEDVKEDVDRMAI